MYFIIAERCGEEEANKKGVDKCQKKELL